MTVSILAGCLLWSPFSNADSLIIQFSSGKTQQVTLNEPVDAIMNIQSRTTGTEIHGDTKTVHSRELYNKETDKKVADKPAEKKKPYTLKWGAPKLGE